MLVSQAEPARGRPWRPQLASLPGCSAYRKLQPLRDGMVPRVVHVQFRALHRHWALFCNGARHGIGMCHQGRTIWQHSAAGSTFRGGTGEKLSMVERNDWTSIVLHRGRVRLPAARDQRNPYCWPDVRCPMSHHNSHPVPAAQAHPVLPLT